MGNSQEGGCDHLEEECCIEADKKAKLIAGVAQEKKAENVLVLDLRSISDICDYFVICDAASITRIEAIVKGVTEVLGLAKINLRHVEGKPESRWTVLDCGDVIVHVFHRETRSFYALERLWGDAPILPLERQRRHGYQAKKKRKAKRDIG